MILYFFRNFQLPFENMQQLLDVYEITSDESVTHICLIDDSPHNFSLCLAIRQDKVHQLMLAECCQTDNSNRTVFKTSVRI